MLNDALGCRSCGKELDERQLVSKSVTVENCPYCGTMFRRSEGFGSTNLAAIIVDDVAATDEWLDRYASDTSNRIEKLTPDGKNEIRWAIGSRHSFAIECVYDEKRTGFLELRCITRNGAATVFERPDRLAEIAARFALQPCGARQRGWDISVGNLSDGYWGMVQYLNISILSTKLLSSIIERSSDAMRIAQSEILGDTKA